MSELKNCPFCGEPFQVTKTIHETYNISHKPDKKCPVERSMEYGTLEYAESVINQRFEDAQQSEIARLRSALEWYADERNYFEGKPGNNNPHWQIGGNYEIKEFEPDNGQRARAALGEK